MKMYLATAFVLFLMGVGLMAHEFYLVRHAMAATPEPVATTEPNDPCPVWKVAGGQLIYKCIDDEPPYATCYVPVGGVMQCLVEQ